MLLPRLDPEHLCRTHVVARHNPKCSSGRARKFIKQLTKTRMTGESAKRQLSQDICEISLLAHVNRAKSFRSLASGLLFLPSIEMKHTSRITSFDHNDQFHKQYQGTTIDYTCCYTAWLMSMLHVALPRTQRKCAKLIM